MSQLEQINRRAFMTVGGRSACAVSAASLIGTANLNPVALSDDIVIQERDPASSLEQLLAGNQRFVEGKLTHPGRSPEEFSKLADGQAPLAVIVGCSDSRVPPEVLFDTGVGDLFVVRVAGNVVNGAGATVKGSIEYAIAELGVPLIVVLGHSDCGAIKAAIKHIDDRDTLPGTINELIEPIRSAYQTVRSEPGNVVENVTRENINRGVKRLMSLPPIVSAAVSAKSLVVVGAVYDLNTGAVTIVE